MLNEFNTQVPKRLASQTLDITPPTEAIGCFSDENHHSQYIGALCANLKDQVPTLKIRR